MNQHGLIRLQQMMLVVRFMTALDQQQRLLEVQVLCWTEVYCEP
jgi:hypothetical protein